MMGAYNIASKQKYNYALFDPSITYNEKPAGEHICCSGGFLRFWGNGGLNIG